MRKSYLKHISIIGLLLLLLPGCVAEAPEEASGNAEENALWLSFEMSNLADASAGKKSQSTRDGEESASSDAKTPQEAAIKSVIALLVDTDDKGEPTRIVSIAKAETSNITAPATGATDQTYKVKVRMTVYALEHLYRLYIFANLSDDDYTYIQNNLRFTNMNTAKSTINNMVASYPSTLADTGLPLGTVTEDAKKIKVYLKENTEYTETNPYYVEADPDDENPGVLQLTPLCSRIDLSANSEHSDFVFPIVYTTGEGATQKTHTEVKIAFKKAVLKNMAKSVYLLPISKSNKRISPALTISNVSTSDPFTMKAGVAIYPPECVPKVTGTTLLTYANVTYLEAYGILDATGCDALSASVNAAITGETHPPLYYYDDGKYQSSLTTTSHKKNGELEAHWQELTYDNTLQGYKVTYRHPIRHDAGKDKNGNDLNNPYDGFTPAMEYGLVRNYIYNICINSVSALPHPWTEDTPLENGTTDISIKINAPKQWDYHRGGSEITFEETE